MSSSKRQYPSLAVRLYSVWYRHMKVYGKNVISNGLPPFVEPLLFLGGIGLGLGKYITKPVGGVEYIQYLGTGLLVTTAMFTSAFECSFGAFIRLEFEKVYDGMLAAPITASNLIVGEILWAGTKGFFFSFCVLVILALFGVVPLPGSLLAPIVGMLTGTMFGTLSLFVTSFIKTINHFNFYFTGFISPMFFFSGVVFPIENLPRVVRPISELVPLTHSVRLVRAASLLDFHPGLLYDVGYVIVFIIVFGFLANKRLRKRLVS